MADRSSDDDSVKQEGSNGTENEDELQQTNNISSEINELKKKNKKLEKDVKDLRERLDKLEMRRIGNVAASPKKTKKKITSDEEANTHRRNEKTKENVNNAIKLSEAGGYSPMTLTEKLVETVFTEDERKVSSRRQLGFWRLQFIREIIMKRFSVSKEAEEDLWKQCKISVTKMLIQESRSSGPSTSAAAANVDGDPVDDDTTSEEDYDHENQQDE